MGPRDDHRQQRHAAGGLRHLGGGAVLQNDEHENYPHEDKKYLRVCFRVVCRMVLDKDEEVDVLRDIQKTLKEGFARPRQAGRRLAGALRRRLGDPIGKAKQRVVAERSRRPILAPRPLRSARARRRPFRCPRASRRASIRRPSASPGDGHPRRPRRTSRCAALTRAAGGGAAAEGDVGVALDVAAAPASAWRATPGRGGAAADGVELRRRLGGARARRACGRCPRASSPRRPATAADTPLRLDRSQRIGVYRCELSVRPRRPRLSGFGDRPHACRGRGTARCRSPRSSR